MKANKLESYSITALTVILGILATTPAKSQPITPSNDGTGTTVNQNGNQFNIQGGTHNGTNLFHSFDQFNLHSGQTANFLTTPDTRNILGRITGGDPSIINGLIQVIGGNSNLFLMNPVGIMFGPNASLNVPASFSVTTATGIGFNSNNFWFQAMGTNDYANLVGNPSGYRFNISNPGAIVNEGNLSLNSGENLTLLGGTVINTGQLSTAGGNVTIAAVEGGSTLRISQPGHLLSLEVGSTTANGEDMSGITPLSLPELLTGGEITQATSMTVNGNGDVVLIDSNTIISGITGDAIASGDIDVSTTPPLSKGGQGGYNIGGQFNVLGDRVAIIDANINADGLNGGGRVLIGGDFQGSGIVPNSQQTFVNNNSFISADATTNGDGGQVIIWSDGITNFAGNISARGGEFSGDGGFVEVSGKQQLIFDGNVNVSAAFGTPGTILLDPENITVGEPENSENSENSESSETETVDDNSEVPSTESTDSPATENTESSETEIVDNNSEVPSTESTDSPTTENTESSETEIVDNNSELPSTENTEENVDNSEVTENSETEIADNSETIETETPIDPFAQDENSDVTISAENIEELSGDIILFADNDITINEKIETTESVELKAGRSININADIDTSIGNGNIELLGNNDEMNIDNRSAGGASINQLDGTTLNAGSGNIRIELGNLGEVGDINLANLTTTGQVLVNANGGNIARVSDSSIINADSVLFETNGSGGIGFVGVPLQLNVENLEAVSGSGGAFFDVLGDVNIGDVSEDVNGIVTAGGDIEIQSAENVTLTESISTIENNSEVESRENTEVDSGTGGAINIEATGDIVATGSGIKASGESVSLSGTNITINDEFDETSGDADVKLEATNDITVEDIADDALEFLPGEGEIEFHVDVDEDGIGAITMLDNEADVGSDPNTFGVDTIKTNGRNLTIAGAGIVLGNLDTSSFDGDGGNIIITAKGKITTGELDSSYARGNAGDVTITTEENIITKEINSYSSSGDGGDITLSAGGDITIEIENSNFGQNTGSGGHISMNAGGNITAGDIDSSYSHDSEGEGGNITIAAQGNITIIENLENGDYSSIAIGQNSGDGGDITLNADGDITTGQINTFSLSNLGNGGDVTLTAGGNIITRDVNSFSSGGTEGSGDGGNITVTAGGNIHTESLNSFSNSSMEGNSGHGGSIYLNADTIKYNRPEYGDTEQLQINTFSVGKNDSGNGGDVNITTNNLSNAEILTLSSHEKSGQVTIESKSKADLLLNDLSIITSKQVSIQLDSWSEAIQIDVGTQGQSGNVNIFSGDNLNLNNVTIESDTKGDQPAGDVYIDSQKNIILDNTEFFSITNAEGHAGNITLVTPRNIKLTNNSQLRASTEGTGNAGSIDIQANKLNLEQGTSLITETYAAGAPGDITIKANTVDIGQDAQISATAVLGATSTGDGGNITINTNELNITGKLGIFAETEASANAGTLTLSPYEDNPNLNINFSNDGFISASTSSTGNGGNINLNAPESIDISGKGFIAVETSDKGNAGTINIETQNLTLSDGVAISASTTDKGNAGAIEIDTEEFILETGTSLTTETNNQGKAGDIEINTRKLTIGEDAQISATAKEGATNTEAGGNITINATDLLISGQLGIFAETAGETPAGTLTLKPYRRGEQGSRENRSARFDPDLNITFTENGFISARTTSSGDGGNINIFAPENINISGEGRITVETEDRGNAGIINIETENLTIAENTTISAATSDRGDGGSININPSQSFQLEGQIITETTGAGDGGKITINTGELSAENSTISAKSTDAGNAGAIEIIGQENITTGIIQSSASESKEAADGGDITITSEQGEINATQPIQSFSENGNAGDVTLSAKTDVTTNTISSHGEQQGGQIIIITETGNIDTSNGFLANYSGEGTGGNVTLEASTGNITTSDIYSFADADGGQILLKAGGDINITENSNVISASEPATTSDTENPGKGGDIILEAGSNINTSKARIYSGADEGDTGTINIVADDAIEVGQIDLASGFVREERSVLNNFILIPKPQGEATQGVAGNISITSNNGTIDTTAGVINSRSPDGTGNITLNARENITVGKLEASALNETKATTGGNVEIISENGEVNSTQAIETFSEQGTAGNVNIQAEGSVNLENILSQGRERGGDITIDTRSENSMDVQGELNTFSTDGIGGDVTLTSRGNISINGIRSEGIQQGGDITLESEIGEISATGDITSFSEEGRGGSIEIDAPESVNLENVLSFGATESGDLRIQSQIATVNTGNVTTQAPDGPSGEVIINGSQITTGNLSSLGTVSSGIIQLEATDGSITTLDLESIASEGEAGGIDLDATGDISSEDQTVISGDGDANIEIDAGGDVSVGNQEAIANQGDANIDIQAGGEISVENQTTQANQGDANINVQPGGNISAETQTVQVNQGDANINIQPGSNISAETQTVQVNQGDTNINIQTGGNIPIEEQTTVSVGGNPTIDNTPDNTNTGEQIAIAPEAIETITNIDSGDTIIPENLNDNQIIPVENLNDSTEIPVTTATETTDIQIDNNQSQSILQQISNNSDFFTLTAPTNYNQTTNAGTAQEQTEASINHTTDTQQILKTINPVNTKSLITATASDQVVTMLERNSLQEYSDFLGANLEEKLISTQSVREILSDMANQTGKESAIVYINVYPEQLQIILYTKEGQPIIKTIAEVNREQIMKVALELRIKVTTPANQDNDSYLSPAQKLYNWLIAPIASELEAANIDTLLFSMDEGLRTLAVAALHDGEQFLIEKYSLSLIPSVSLMDTNYRPLQDTQVLAMGASEFIAHNSLPGVPIELEIVSQELWQGSMFLNEDFTLNNLIAQRENYPYPIIHLATHADFRPGKISNSYIQLWGEEQIKLDQIRELGWNESSVELLVLSACRTAFGDKDAELGFAGLAIAAGVKSALASIWYVNDRATLALMTEFYSHLNQTKIKAEAVRQAQLAMLRGDVVIKENQIRRLGERGSVELPSVLGEMRNRKLSHPYHWAGFTMVGSPW
ncbi:CHAT domain-containing protein [Okeania sp. SIO2B3]|uniref:CHAT domain-containing protein n=1 Tax=Okeania sp. SIO2B3 TaxID=2607784 RepID=UPI0013C1CEA4|nr:CHAT domain-containing protein [Okeania sp. SIO2B3]NET44683.1 CHAT domain-containing protein [Okeania sp. SIO2B3]